MDKLAKKKCTQHEASYRYIYKDLHIYISTYIYMHIKHTYNIYIYDPELYASGESRENGGGDDGVRERYRSHYY